MSAAASRIRLLVSDIDGTLINTDKQLTAATLEAAQALQQAGIRLCLVSSRSVRGMRMYLEQLALDTPAAGLNGGEIVDAKGTLLEHLHIDEAAARLAVGTMASNDIDTWLFSGADWVIRDPDGPYVPRERRAVQFEPTVVEDFEPWYPRIGKIMGACSDPERLERVELDLQSRLAGRASAHRSSAYYLDITHPDANKGHAAERLAAMFGLGMSEVACIGDMDNDISMLRRAGLSIAMGNAPEQVASVAHYVTATNQQEGWAQAVERYVLPRAPTQ